MISDNKEYLLIGISCLILIWLVKPKIILYVDDNKSICVSKTRFVILWAIFTALLCGIYYYNKDKIVKISAIEDS